MTIRSMPSNDAYRENYDRVFGEKPECPVCAGRNHPTDFRGNRLKACPVCDRKFEPETKR